jgi:hypothetical protein
MKKSEPDMRKPVTKVVHDILEQARLARAEGPASSIYRRETQMSVAMSQAGTTLAKMDRGAAGRKPSIMHSLLGSIVAAPKPKARRSWIFASTATAMPDAKRIEQLLKTKLKDGRRLVLDQVSPEAPSAVNDDMICHLPKGATDPVCEPR